MDLAKYCCLWLALVGVVDEWLHLVGLIGYGLPFLAVQRLWLNNQYAADSSAVVAAAVGLALDLMDYHVACVDSVDKDPSRLVCIPVGMRPRKEGWMPSAV